MDDHTTTILKGSLLGLFVFFLLFIILTFSDILVVGDTSIVLVSALVGVAELIIIVILLHRRSQNKDEALEELRARLERLKKS